jgi:hypothetical protein
MHQVEGDVDASEGGVEGVAIGHIPTNDLDTRGHTLSQSGGVTRKTPHLLASFDKKGEETAPHVARASGEQDAASRGRHASRP